MKQLTLIILFAAALLSACSGNKTKKATTSIKQKPKAAVKLSGKKAMQSFDDFLKRFNADSVYQKAHVKFPLKMELTNESGETDSIKYLPENKWVYYKLVNHDNNLFAKERIDETRYSIIYQIKDTGFMLYHYFTYDNGEWLLESTKDMGD